MYKKNDDRESTKRKVSIFSLVAFQYRSFFNLIVKGFNQSQTKQYTLLIGTDEITKTTKRKDHWRKQLICHSLNHNLIQFVLLGAEKFYVYLRKIRLVFRLFLLAESIRDIIKVFFELNTQYILFRQSHFTLMNFLKGISNALRKCEHLLYTFWRKYSIYITNTTYTNHIV